MTKQVFPGKCFSCERIFAKSVMGRHLNSCYERKSSIEEENGEKQKILHLVVQGYYSPQYWMHLEVVGNAKLKALDHFLRDAWLECCGHLSAFTIEGTSYQSDMVDSEPGDKSMNAKIATVLSPGMKFVYEYDFGTTTTLALKVLSERIGTPKLEPIDEIAENIPPKIACSVCGKDAKQVCAQCIDEGEGWLCNKCAKTHECGEEMLLPVVNSPRVGMCAYTGHAYE